MSKRNVREREKKIQLLLFLVLKFFELYLFDMSIMYQVRVNIVFLQLLENINDIFKISEY